MVVWVCVVTYLDLLLVFKFANTKSKNKS